MNSSTSDGQIRECAFDRPGTNPGGNRRCELDDNLERLRQVSAFSSVPLERLKLLAYLGRRICFPDGSVLFRQGDRDDRAFIVISGSAQVIRDLKDRSVILNEFKEGTFFGGLALLANIRRPVTVRARTQLVCLVVDRESFRKVLGQSPDVILKILEAMLERHSRMLDKLLDQMPDCKCEIGT